MKKIYLTVLVSCMLALSFAQNSNVIPQGASYLRDTVAPDFSVVTINGDTLSYADLQGKVLVMNFWTVEYNGCVYELPELNRLVQKYAGNENIVFISLLLEDKSYAERIDQRYKVEYQLVANSEEVHKAFQIDCYPAHVVVGPDGVIHTNFCDIVTAEQLEKEINNALGLLAKL